MRWKTAILISLGVSGVLLGGALAPLAWRAAGKAEPHWFATSDVCTACHSGLVSSAGTDLSLGLDWRTSVMAQAARDPYWQASVRRETVDHPIARSHIEDECSRCHAPMATTEANAAGRPGTVFRHFETANADRREDQLARDGVSCTLCHQITRKNLGESTSFVGRFAVDERLAMGERAAFGPFPIDDTRASLMQSTSQFRPIPSDHVRDSGLCATCHTLYTDAVGPHGEIIGRLPEQVPYLEWLRSDYSREQSCQVCHMTEVNDGSPFTNILPVARKGWRRHEFQGANVLLPQWLSGNATELRTDLPARESAAAVSKTRAFLTKRAATISIQVRKETAGRIEADVRITHSSGHKLPTAYPSRRAWVHFAVSDAEGKTLFESGALEPTGAIAGNDNDRDPSSYEPHHARIDAADQVQVYEAILGDARGRPTTGLLSAVRYLKDNRLLPRGFEKENAPGDVAVHGEAADDADFSGGEDHVLYIASVESDRGPLRILAELWFEPVSYRWAHNLESYAAEEPRRFVRYFDASARTAAVLLARADAVVP